MEYNEYDAHVTAFTSWTMLMKKEHLATHHGLDSKNWTWGDVPESWSVAAVMVQRHTALHLEALEASIEAHPAGKGKMMAVMKEDPTTQTKKQIEIMVPDPWNHAISVLSEKARLSDIQRKVEWLESLQAQVERMHGVHEPGWELKEVTLKPGRRQVAVVGTFVPVSVETEALPETHSASQDDEKALSDVQRMTANVQRLSDVPLIPRYCIHCGGILTNPGSGGSRRCTVCNATYSVNYG